MSFTIAVTLILAIIPLYFFLRYMGFWKWIELPSGEVLKSDKGTYIVREKLGQGGMGTVYKADFTSTKETGRKIKKKVVALKKLKFDSFTHDLCKREIAIMTKISASSTSTNNVKMYDGFSSNLEKNTLCISMEYCEIGDLAGRIKEYKSRGGRKFDAKLVYQYMYDIANGLDELHVKHKIVHRDIKPQNILISYDWPAGNCGIDCNGKKREVLKISDYGICKLVDIVETVAGPTNTLIMTPLYAAPEQLAHRACGTPADIWAVGMIFYELCACPGDFYSLARSIREIIGSGRRVALSGFPSEDEKWLNDMLKKNPADRMTSGELYRTALVRKW